MYILIYHSIHRIYIIFYNMCQYVYILIRIFVSEVRRMVLNSWPEFQDFNLFSSAAVWPNVLDPLYSLFLDQICTTVLHHQVSKTFANLEISSKHCKAYQIKGTETVSN